MSGWIGVDMDGTLFEFPENGSWLKWDAFGAPIAPMVERVRAWLATGEDVRIVTARVGLPLYMGHRPTFSSSPRHQCRTTGEWFSDRMMVAAIEQHCIKHVGHCLPVQCWKDYDMKMLYDDRAVQVRFNTGELVEYTIAEMESNIRDAIVSHAGTEEDTRD